MLQSNVARIQADIEAMARFTATPEQGVTRFSFTEQDWLTRTYIKDRMKHAGLTVREDEAGTVIGRRAGVADTAPVVMVGSHFDSVKNGGPFDGPAGVVTALEIADVLHENHIKTKHPIEFIAMIEEEGGRFGAGLFGSRAMVGRVTPEELQTFKDAEGVSVAEAMTGFGFDPLKIKDAVRKTEHLKAFFELHIEQGPVLEKMGLDVGIVETVVGIEQFEVFVEGRPDHAGTTPMDMRCDALVAATDIVRQVQQIASKAGSGTVGTVGRMSVGPGAANIVPGRVMFTVDIRSSDASILQDVGAKIRHAVSLLPKEHPDIRCSVVPKLLIAPTALSADIMKLLEDESRKRGISTKRMLSGAGHDAMVMAAVTNVGLVFVPSRGGRSHCPEEWTEYVHLKKGVDVVLGALLQVAGVVS